MADLLQFVNTVGFPATMCVLFFLNAWEENKARREETSKMLEQLKECEAQLRALQLTRGKEEKDGGED